MFHLALVMVGGAAGAGLRHLTNLAALRLAGPSFPWGTLAVNLLGCFAMGLVAAWLSRRLGGASDELRLFLATGILGGFTTFSAFSLDIAVLWERGAASQAFLYMLGSVAGSLLALFAGLSLARAFA